MFRNLSKALKAQKVKFATAAAAAPAPQTNPEILYTGVCNLLFL